MVNRLLPAIAAGAAMAVQARGADHPLVTVPHVDISRSAVTWYEFARTPNRFENNCTRDVRATYTLRPDGKVGVRNECVKSGGKRNVANGYAKIADASTNANALIRIHPRLISFCRTCRSRPMLARTIAQSETRRTCSVPASPGRGAVPQL